MKLKIHKQCKYPNLIAELKIAEIAPPHFLPAWGGFPKPILDLIKKENIKISGKQWQYLTTICSKNGCSMPIEYFFSKTISLCNSDEEFRKYIFEQYNESCSKNLLVDIHDDYNSVVGELWKKELSNTYVLTIADLNYIRVLTDWNNQMRNLMDEAVKKEAMNVFKRLVKECV